MPWVRYEPGVGAVVETEREVHKRGLKIIKSLPHFNDEEICYICNKHTSTLAQVQDEARESRERNF